MDSNINLFPNPPKYYKNFVKDDSFCPPDLNLLNKISNFMTFGVDYKMKEVNSPNFNIDNSFLKQYDPQLINKYDIPNRKIFEGNDVQLALLTCDNLNIDIFNAIESEINFVRKNYFRMIDQITKLQDFELSSCFIKYSFQKIYFLLSLLKKKKILIEINKYFKNETENNITFENLLTSNLENTSKCLINEINLIKEDLQ